MTLDDTDLVAANGHYFLHDLIRESPDPNTLSASDEPHGSAVIALRQRSG